MGEEGWIKAPAGMWHLWDQQRWAGVDVGHGRMRTLCGRSFSLRFVGWERPASGQTCCETCLRSAAKEEAPRG